MFEPPLGDLGTTNVVNLGLIGIA